MIDIVRIEDKIAASYADLSIRLKDAADYVVANPVDVATRSLRQVSAASGVSPATLSRLARTLGFDTYEDMREMCRGEVSGHSISFSERAERLMADKAADQTMLERQSAACVINITQLGTATDQARLSEAVDHLVRARQVVLFGAFGSSGIVEYMAYLASYFTDTWSLAGRMGASLASALAGLGEGDVLLIVTKEPYARRAVMAAEMAQAQGAVTIVISDSHVCPANKFATFPFIVPSDSPQFFSSYAATLTLIEAIMAMLVARSEAGASQRIREVENRNRSLGEFWADN